MVINSENKSDIRIIRITDSKINFENADKFQKETVLILEEESPEKLAIDFSNVKYISSIAISSLSIINGMATNKCDIVLFNLAPAVKETLELTGINSLFDVYTSEEEMLENFS